MGVASTVLLVLGILSLLDAGFALIFTKASKDMLKSMAKYLSKEANIRKVASYELIVAIILIVIAFFL